MKLLTKSLLLSLLVLSSSCAYFGNSKTTTVSIASNPSGADIFIEGKNYGKTPITLNLEPKNYAVTVAKEGHGSAIINLETWQTIRETKGEGGRCLADAMGSLLVLPYLSLQSVYCRDFKQKEYFVNIPYSGQGVNRVDYRDPRGAAPYYQEMMNKQNMPNNPSMPRAVQ